METIYIDSLFLMNLIIDYLLLRLTARLCGEALTRRRCAIGAALGALGAVGCFVPGFYWLNSAPGKALLWLAISLAAFGFSRALPRCALGFLGVSAAFGGAVWAASMLSGGAAVYSGSMVRVGAPTLVFSFALCYALLSLVFPGRGEARRCVARLRIVLRGAVAELTALRDTGNELREPSCGRRVIIASPEALSPLFTPAELEALSKRGGAEALLAIAGVDGAPRFIPVSYRAVGVGAALLPAFAPDALYIDGEAAGGYVVAVSPDFTGGADYRALL